MAYELLQSDAASPPYGIDSRQYIYSFPLRSVADIPADFIELQGAKLPLAGVFLPQDGRRKRKVCSPACVLLLYERGIATTFHPSSERPGIYIPLNSLKEIETGRFLLLGWITLTWTGGRLRLPYNTCNDLVITSFIKRVENVWLPPEAVPGNSRCMQFGAPLCGKFAQAAAHELLVGETPLMCLFQPARYRFTCWGTPGGGVPIAGDLLMATVRRLIWIEERRNGRYEPYGTVSHSASVSSLAHVQTSMVSKDSELNINFTGGERWRIPLQKGMERDSNGFAIALRREFQIGE